VHARYHIVSHDTPVARVADHAAHAGCACCSPRMRLFNERVAAELSRRAFLGGAAALAALFAGPRPAGALTERPAAPERPVLFTNVKVFDGVRPVLRDGVAILVKGDRIEALPGVAQRVDGARVIDCGGRLAMPGLIDAHWHALLCGLPEIVVLTAEVPYVHLVAAREAERTLLRGFTTVRDVGGPSFALKRAIDQGIVVGPRIYPSGAMISQTSGHGDFRMRYEVPRSGVTPPGHPEMAGVSALADGESEVLRRVREQLLLGASQIKLAAGGGVSSVYDPLDTVQFTDRELRAAVDAAQDWGTYVTVHVYVPRGIQRAIRNGVACIEHGQLADEESVRMMAGEGTWWSLQPFLGDEDANEKPDPASRAKQMEVARGTERAYELSQKHKVKVAWGTDILFSPQNLPHQARQLAKLTRFYPTPLDLLCTATGHAGELMRLSGPRNPYPAPVGVIAPGAMADILIADGDPTRSLDFLTDPARNLRVVMKDGRIYKDTLAA